MIMLEFERNKMIATLLFVAAMFVSSNASGTPDSQSYGGYNQHRQFRQQQYQPQQQQQQQQQQDRWHAEVSPASYVAETSASSIESKAPSEGTEPPTLPEGWSEHFDPNSGQNYYYNAADGTTSWDRPEPPGRPEQKLVGSETKGEASQPSELNPESAEATGALRNPEQTPEEKPQDSSMVGMEGMDEKDKMPGLSSEYETWQANQDPHINQPGSTRPKIQPQPQPTNWERQGQSGFAESDDRGSQQLRKQQLSGSQWAQSNSTDPSVVGGESEIQKSEYQGQPLHAQQLQGQSAVWGLPNRPKVDDSSEKPLEPWGVQKHPEERHQHIVDPRKQPPGVSSKDNQISSSDPSKDNSSTNERWGMPISSERSSSSDRTQNVDPSFHQRQAWQEPHPASSNQRPPESPQRPPVQEISQQDSRVSSTQYPPRPHYLQRQYPPPHGSYDPNTPSGQVQYDPKYATQNPYVRGYPNQQPSHLNPSNSGQLVSQGADAGTSAVKEALSTTWKGLLGFGNKTREVVGTARDQVVTGATAAGQSLSAKSSSIWETAKSTVGGVFENNDSGSQPYALSGHNVQAPTNNRPSYQGRPNGPNQGYPGAPVGPGGRGTPPRTFGGPQQQPGRYGPQTGQQPRYGAPPESGSIEPPGRQQPSAPYQQSMRPPGYPNMQPRRDQPYPQTPKGQERGPIQSQYPNQPGSQQPAQGVYPGQYPGQQRPPNPGPPQPDRGPAMAQGRPQQKEQPDPWDHPGLTGDY